MKKDISAAVDFLVLTMSHQLARVYSSRSGRLVLLPGVVPESTEPFHRDRAEKVGNFTDADDIKDHELERFIRQVDKDMNTLVNKYQVKYYVLGPVEVIGHYNKLTHHAKDIIDFVKGNFDRATVHELETTLSGAPARNK